MAQSALDRDLLLNLLSVHSISSQWPATWSLQTNKTKGKLTEPPPGTLITGKICLPISILFIYCSFGCISIAVLVAYLCIMSLKTIL